MIFNKNYFNGKVVWVTGASSGIGEALIFELAKQGALIILSARRKNELIRVKNDAGLTDSNAFILPFDLAEHSSFKEITEKAISWQGHIDVLINNGGLSQRALISETTLEVERKIFDVNYFGTIELTRQVLPHMIARKSGHINVVSSVLGKLSIPLRSTYCSSKHALHGYFDALRGEVHSHNIGVSIVCPGYIKTAVSINALKADGSNHNRLDMTQAKGMDARKFARKMLRKMAAGREEFNIGGPEIYGIYAKRFIPWLVSRVTRTMVK